MEWYALFVETGKEPYIEKWLQTVLKPASYLSLIPKRKLIEKHRGVKYTVIRKLFPGYVFLKTEMSFDKYYAIKKLPGMFGVLNHGDYFTKISNDEMQPIMKLLCSGDTIDLSQIYTVGARTYINSGPLAGLDGIIKSINKHQCRAKVMLDFLGTTRQVDLGLEWLYSKTDECRLFRIEYDLPACVKTKSFHPIHFNPYCQPSEHERRYQEQQ